MLASDLARRRSAERYGAGSRRERDGMLAGNSIALATQQVVAPIQGMHRAISERWFAAAGTPARPFRMMHLAVSDVVYGSIRAGGTIAGWAFDTRLSDEESEPRAAAHVPDMSPAWLISLPVAAFPSGEVTQ